MIMSLTQALVAWQQITPSQQLDHWTAAMAQHLVPSITPVNISFKKALQERDLLLNHFPHEGITELGLSATKERTWLNDNAKTLTQLKPCNHVIYYGHDNVLSIESIAALIAPGLLLCWGHGLELIHKPWRHTDLFLLDRGWLCHLWGWLRCAGGWLLLHTWGWGWGWLCHLWGWLRCAGGWLLLHTWGWGWGWLCLWGGGWLWCRLWRAWGWAGWLGRRSWAWRCGYRANVPRRPFQGRPRGGGWIHRLSSKANPQVRVHFSPQVSSPFQGIVEVLIGPSLPGEVIIHVLRKGSHSPEQHLQHERLLQLNQLRQFNLHWGQMLIRVRQVSK